MRTDVQSVILSAQFGVLIGLCKINRRSREDDLNKLLSIHLFDNFTFVFIAHKVYFLIGELLGITDELVGQTTGREVLQLYPRDDIGIAIQRKNFSHRHNLTSSLLELSSAAGTKINFGKLVAREEMA
jgi:hypothetical protein